MKFLLVMAAKAKTDAANPPEAVSAASLHQNVGVGKSATHEIVDVHNALIRESERKHAPQAADRCGGDAMSGGRASREKGNRTECAIVRLLQEHGLAGERVPLTGAARGRFGGDISVLALGRELRSDAKCRGNGFACLYDWLEGRDFLVIRTDRKPFLVVNTLELAAEVERAKGGAQ